MSTTSGPKTFKGPQRIAWERNSRFVSGSSATIEPGHAYVLSGTGAFTFAFDAPSSWRGSKTIVEALGADMTLSGSGDAFAQSTVADPFVYNVGDLLTIADGEIVTLETDGANHYVVRGSGSLA